MMYERVILSIISLFLSYFPLLADNSKCGELDIKIQCSKKYEELAKYTESTIKKSLPKICSVIGNPEDTIIYILVDSEDQFRRYIGFNSPSWANGMTLFPKGIVVIKTPDLTYSTLRSFRRTIVHELVHIIQGQQVPLNLTPVWFNEGLAVYLSEEYNLRSKIVLSRAITKKKLIPLDKLSDILNFSNLKAELAYDESTSVIEYLIQVYGFGIIREIFDNMRSGRSFENSIKITTGIDYSNFSYFWEQYISKTYRWVFLLDIQYILWLIMPLLLILAYLSIRYRNRETTKIWEDQEKNENRISE